jgi:cellulose synthase/poly-beta-1,6-N-acetylglucosamine synthase-like glycosyltransferase
MKKISIIIPVKEVNDYIREAIPHHMELDYPDYEVLIFPDEPTDEQFPYSNVYIIPSGKVGPADKRDMAMQYAKGEIFAFIDDDAWPRKDWLKNAMEELKNTEVGAVGGPAVTAPNDSLIQMAGGKTYESFLCSGNYTYRYIPKWRREDDDLPSVNLIVKREVFESVNGYDSNYYPGEDTKLCMDIVNSGKKIIYNPNVLVYHHRRALFKAHLKQVTNYAKHRGYFAKKLPQTSLRFAYFIPTLFVLGLVMGPILSIFFPVLWYVYFGIILLYLILAAYSLRSCKSIKLFLLSMCGIIATHIGYGICFVQGLMSKKLIR